MRNARLIAALSVIVALLAAACGNSPEATGEDGAATTPADTADTPEGTDTPGGTETDADTPEPVVEGEGEPLSGSIEIDGSSTVAPLTEAIAEEYSAEQPDVRANIGVSGTGGGFERFCAGETDISNASRPIDEEEVALCEEAGVDFTELRVGTDALTVVVNPANDFATCLTFDELTAIFGAEEPAANWNEVNPEFPDSPLQVFAPDVDSGTYDFMLETLDIEESRQDYSASSDDNQIVTGVQGSEGGWGFFGFAYFQENEEALKAVEIDGGEGCVAPAVETAQDDSYPLTRPLFIYVKNEALTRPEVADFASFYLDNVGEVITDVGYIPEPEEAAEEARSALDQALGSAG